jgi:CBS domain-containing protein
MPPKENAMAIGEICSRDVFFVRRSETVALAARLMRDKHIGSLVVADEQEGRRVPVGMITDRDIAVGVVALGLDPEATLVEVAMRPEVFCIREDEGVGRAVSLMRGNAVRRLPVVNAAGALVGVLAADDLLELLGEELAGLSAAVSRGMRREHETRRAA